MSESTVQRLARIERAAKSGIGPSVDDARWLMAHVRRLQSAVASTMRELQGIAQQISAMEHQAERVHHTLRSAR